MDLEDIIDFWKRATKAQLKGWGGEVKTKLTHGLLLSPKKYHTFNNVLIPSSTSSGGSSQIDHVIVSVYGIFVVETKDRGHWIFGNENDRQWTQVHFKQKRRFPNPLHQNHGHIMALKALLGLDVEVFHSLVAFWGADEFKPKRPDKVVTSIPEYYDYFTHKRQVILSQEQVDAVVQQLTILKSETTSADHRTHVETLKQQRRCPKCGAILAERLPGTDKAFMGCSRFPRCRYTESV
jgi:ribosomal protein S27AE